MYALNVIHISLTYMEENMNISYDYYRIFYYVAKYKSFTGAAKARLNNQPNITRMMKKLEHLPTDV